MLVLQQMRYVSHKSGLSKKLNMIERLFEKALWASRYVTILPVLFGLLGAIILFLVASYDVFHVLGLTWKFFFQGYHPEGFHSDIVSIIIGAVDLYLIALVLYIFSFGIYELFISKIDEIESAQDSKVLEVHSLDQLKDKIAKVIVMVLVVSFFQRVLHTDYHGALEMGYFALSILALSVGLYFLHKGGKH